MAWQDAIAEKAPSDSRMSHRDNVAWGADSLRARTSHGHAVYLETLEHLARHPEWDDVVVHDLKTCPARSWHIDAHKLPPLDGLSRAQKAQIEAWFEVPFMEHITDAYLRTMEVQHVAIQRLLGAGVGR
jgi:hypothetical protein